MKHLPALMVTAVAALTLASCAPSLVRTSDARLAAVAQSPQGTYSFDCNPALNAQQSGLSLPFGSRMSFSCPSLDGRASLALLVYREEAPSTPYLRYVRPPNAPNVFRPAWFYPPLQPSVTVTQVLLVLPGVSGAAPVSFTGEAKNTLTGQGLFYPAGGLQGTFSADLGGGVKVQGSFNLLPQ